MGPDGNLYVSSAPGGTTGSAVRGVLRYSGSTGEFMDIFTQHPGLDPFGLAFGPDGNLYVADFTANSVLRFNGSTGAFIDIFTSDAHPLAPRGLLFGPDGHLHVSSPGDGRVLKFNGSTGVYLGVSASGVDARDLVFGPDRNLYVASFNTNRVLRFDGSNGQFLDTFAMGGGLDGPVGRRFGPDGDLYVGSFNNYGVLRYDGETGEFNELFVHYGNEGLGQPRIFTFVIPVAIDVKPGTAPNEINANSNSAVPGAILSSATFDATRIDPETVRFANAAVRRVARKRMCHKEDVGGGPNGSPDGLLDLICQFRAGDLKFAPGATTGVLTGSADDVPLRGEDNIIPLGF